MRSRHDSRQRQIGLDRLVRLEWLEQTACLLLSGNDAYAVKTTLQEELREAFRSKDPTIRGSLDKSLTILMRIWVRPPSDLVPFQRDGLELLSQLPRKDHVAVHWGMTMAVYPFWAAVATHVGRLLRLQDRVVARQVQRRLREQYGERETVSRRVRYVLRSFIDWKILKETTKKGAYTTGITHPIAQTKLAAWLAEAFLHTAPSGPKPLKTVLDSTSLFPFRFRPISAPQLVAASKRLDALQHGIDQDLLMLRTENLQAAKGGRS